MDLHGTDLLTALEATRAELRRTAEALDIARGDVERTTRRLEFAQDARRSAEVERTRFQTALSAARAVCHRTLADPDADPAARDIAQRVLAALDART
jgi:hypothetical protein